MAFIKLDKVTKINKKLRHRSSSVLCIKLRSVKSLKNIDGSKSQSTFNSLFLNAYIAASRAVEYQKIQ